MLTYRRSDGTDGIGTFSFLNPRTSEDFNQDLILFMQGRTDMGVLKVQ